MNTIIYIGAAVMLLCGVYAVMCGSILRSAIGLAFSSAALSVVLYAMDAKWASVLELSVCSGLVTVIFIAGISLSRSPKMELEKEYRDLERSRQLPLILILAGAAMTVLALVLGFEMPEMQPDQALNFKDVLWNTCQSDIWAQIAAILCGGVAVAVLFREERQGDK